MALYESTLPPGLGEWIRYKSMYPVSSLQKRFNKSEATITLAILNLTIFYSFTPKILLVILLTICYTILMMSVQRIWYWMTNNHVKVPTQASKTTWLFTKLRRTHGNFFQNQTCQPPSIFIILYSYKEFSHLQKITTRGRTLPLRVTNI